jgi:hypothetical protein
VEIDRTKRGGTWIGRKKEEALGFSREIDQERAGRLALLDWGKRRDERERRVGLAPIGNLVRPSLPIRFSSDSFQISFVHPPASSQKY